MLTNSRRNFLGALLGSAALAGCGAFDREPEPVPPPDAFQPLLDEALALATAYDRAIAGQPALAARLTPLAEDHRAHAADLTRLIGGTVGSAAPAAEAPSAAQSAGTQSAGTSSSPAETVATLRKAEQAAQQTAVAACRAAPADRAMLAGSIAACRATHAEALR